MGNILKIWGWSHQNINRTDFLILLPVHPVQILQWSKGKKFSFRPSGQQLWPHSESSTTKMHSCAISVTSTTGDI